MKNTLFLFLIVLSADIIPQKFIEEYKPPEGYLRIGSEQEQMIPMVEKGFTLILPEKDKVKGLLVIPGGKRIDFKTQVMNSGTLEHEALKKDIAVLHIFTGNPLDFYFTKDVLVEVTKKIVEIILDNDLKGIPFYLTGTSLSGTRSLKIAIYLETNKEKFWLRPAAVAVIDSPLDMVRFWDAQNRALINNFHPDAGAEAKWITYLLKENLGTPQENFNNYVDYSPFVYNAEDGGNAEDLRNIPVRAYHNPNVNWWIENYRKDYYSMNSVDMAGIINQLLLLNNKNAELKTIFQQGSDISVDYAELMDWFLSFQN